MYMSGVRVCCNHSLHENASLREYGLYNGIASMPPKIVLINENIHKNSDIFPFVILENSLFNELFP